MSKPRENRNGAGRPRNKKAQHNLDKNEKARIAKAENGGVSKRERERVLSGKNHRGFLKSLKGKDA